jgi:Dolichyl-phosphate-mannose-protein mannosyltransferase
VFTSKPIPRRTALLDVEPDARTELLRQPDPPSRTRRTAPRAAHSRWLRNHAIVVMVIACFAIFAGFHIFHSSIWYDEAITLLTTSGHANLDWALGLGQFKPTANFARILSDLYTQDVHPPLYFWTLATWRVIFGSSLEVARSFSALFMLAALVLLYDVARHTGMRRPWIPVAIFAASSAGTWYAYDARSYAMATFLILLTQVLARRKSRWTGVCGAASVATHYFAALCVGPLLAVEYIARWKSDRRWVAWTALSLGLCASPLLLLLRVHLLARPQQYPGFGFFPVELWSLLKGTLQSAMPNTWLPGWGLLLLLGAYVAAAGVWSAVTQKKFALPLLYGAFLCAFLLLAILTNKSVAQMPSAYYLGLAAPWLALLIGFGFNASPRVSPALALLIGVGVIAAKPIVTTKDYRQMVSAFRADCPECSIVVGKGYAGAAPACVLYEAKGMPVVLVNTDDSPDEILQRAGKQRPIFVVQTTEPPTAESIDRFVQSYPSESKNGYFEVYGAGSERAFNWTN